MSFGTWGGQIPVVNFIATRGVFAAMRWRFAVQRFRNRLRRHSVTMKNGPEVAAQLAAFLADGYDRLNVGGGPKNLRGFVNIDFVRYPQAQRQIVANVLDLHFIDSETIAQVHTNHVVEHLTEEQIEAQLREYHRILKPGGLLTLRCPNALGAAYGFWFDPILEDDPGEFVRLGFPSDETLAEPADRWGHKDLYATMHWFFGDVGNIENQHLTQITPTKIRRLVEGAGFDVVKSAVPEALNIVLVAVKKP